MLSWKAVPRQCPCFSKAQTAWLNGPDVERSVFRMWGCEMKDTSIGLETARTGHARMTKPSSFGFKKKVRFGSHPPE